MPAGGTVRTDKLKKLTYLLPVVGTLLLVSLMYRPPGGNHDRWRQPEKKMGGKVPPPAWSPEWNHYPFRKWLKDFNLWLNMTDYSASQTATALVQTMQGTARLMCDEYPMHHLTHGRLDPATRVHTDPVSMILEDLAQRFAPRIEEDQKLIDQELESFARFPNEKFEAMLYRYHHLVARQRDEGLQLFSWRHHALRILRDCGLSGHSLHDVFLQLNHQIPDTRDAYENLLEDLRRRTRLLEYSTVNPYVLLQEQGHRPRDRDHRERRSYFTDGTSPADEAGTYLAGSSSEPARQENGPWSGSLCNVHASDSGGPTVYFGQPNTRQTAPLDEPQTALVYMIGELYDGEGESSSATSSDHGTEDEPELTNGDSTMLAYFQYKRAKRVWRRETGRPTRRFRRAFRIHKHTKFTKDAHSSGRPYQPRFDRSYHTFLSRATRSERDEFMHYLSNKGKGKGKGSGKGIWKTPEPSGQERPADEVQGL